MSVVGFGTFGTTCCKSFRCYVAEKYDLSAIKFNPSGTQADHRKNLEIQSQIEANGGFPFSQPDRARTP